MEIIADFQIHSRYAMATSKDITIENLERYARMKGIDLLGTGDFTHPVWLKELKEKFTEDGSGILKTKSGYNFILQAEVSNIYNQDGKLRKVHNLILAKNFETAEQINDLLSRKGDLKSDGRPVFGNYTCVELVEDLVGIDKDIEIIPAHALTPWFGVFGSKSGFDSIEECFKDQARHIHAIETGMSADPAMIWRVDNWSKYTLVSNSDAHCVHPNTFITLRDGYVLPISEIENENIITHVDFKDMSCENGIRVQYSKVPSPEILKEIEYAGGVIKVSGKHRFYVLNNDIIYEKFASEINKGDVLIRIAKIPHNYNGSLQMKRPSFDSFFSLSIDGLNFIKLKRKEFGLTQEDLAELIKIFPNHYWKIERGLVKINEKFLRKIAALLNFSYEEFIKTNAIDVYPKITPPDKSSVNLFELLGYFLGDGCFTIINRGKCLILTDKNQQVLEYYKNIIKSLFNCNSRLFKYKKQNSYGLIVPSYVARFFALNFPEIVLKGSKRRVTRKIYTAPLEEIAGFLRGFFDAEGSVEHHGVKATSANMLLLYQIDSLLKKFGILSSIYLNQLEKIKKKYRHNIVLYGENLRRFKENIHFNHPIKQLKLEKYVKNLQIKRKSKIKRIGDFILSEVKSVKDLKSDVGYLYDIAVPGYENYIANQVVVHNSFWPWRLGREATVFDFRETSYDNIIKAIRTGEGLKETIEVNPAYGKYHWDGHKACNVCLSPKEAVKYKNICPVCRKGLTIGVEHRIEEMANKPEGHRPHNAKPFVSLIPLSEIIAAVVGSQPFSKGVWEIYNKLMTTGSEFNILRETPIGKIKEIAGDKIAQAVKIVREGEVKMRPGFDGVYGEPVFNGEKQLPRPAKKQKSLADF